MTTLRITEIFHSLQGEARAAGQRTVFVRLTGCPLRCVYCDTEYAFQGGRVMPQEEILDEVARFDPPCVCVTGGEPLAQKGCWNLLTALADRGYDVSLETSGAMDTTGVDPRVSVVLDLKTPASGEVARNLYANIDRLQPHDQVKFVICDRADYEWARFKLGEYDLLGRCETVLFSASHGQLAPETLAAWILEDRLNVRLQLQLHKYLWGDKPGV